MLELIGLDGRVVASAKGNDRSVINGTCGNDLDIYPATMPSVSTSAGRVYYLDGDTDVRYLAPDGSTGLATRVPGNSQAAAMFAVSPDDRRIAVAVFDYRSKPIVTRLYVEDLAGGGNRTDLPAPAGVYRWPAGWHSGNLVMGVSPSSNPSLYLDTPLAAPLARLELLDPTSGRIIASLGTSACTPTLTLPTPAGIACTGTNSNGVGTIDWSGKTTIFSTDLYSSGSISPDGRYVLAETITFGILRLISSPSAGGGVVEVGGSAGSGNGGDPGVGGWLDASHVVVRRIGSMDLLVVAIPGGSMTPLVSLWALVGALPGGY
jgi:hypothetical protein